MKYVNYFFIVLFVASAALQYNDPDPYLWIPIYLYGAVICYLSIKKIFIPAMFFSALVLYCTYGAYLFFAADGVLEWMQKYGSENIAQSMKASRPWIEQTREFFGLVILIAAVCLNMKWQLRTSFSGYALFNIVR